MIAEQVNKQWQRNSVVPVFPLNAATLSVAATITDTCVPIRRPKHSFHEKRFAVINFANCTSPCFISVPPSSDKHSASST